MRGQSRRQLLQGALASAGLGVLTGRGWLPFQVQHPRVPRVGFLAPGSPPPAPQHLAFLQGLRDLGYVEGRTIAIEYR